MNKKGLALVLALTLLVVGVVAGTLAWLTAKSDVVTNTFTTSDIKVELKETTGTEYKMIPGYTISKNPKATVLAGSEECYLFVKLDKSASFDTYLEYVIADGWTKPAETEAPKECTCGAAEGETHKEGCPLYVKPVSNASKHIDTCTEGCTGEDCKCPCHLFDRLMACQTLEEIEAIIKATPEDVLKSLSEEQVAQVEAYMDSLMPAPLPAIVIEESEPPVESEIYRPTVNYTNVAPFGEPVTGGN